MSGYLKWLARNAFGATLMFTMMVCAANIVPAIPGQRFLAAYSRLHLVGEVVILFPFWAVLTFELYRNGIDLTSRWG